MPTAVSLSTVTTTAVVDDQASVPSASGPSVGMV
jgi:hypothetical protein